MTAPIDIIGIYGPDWISVSHISYFGQVPSRLKSILFDPSYLMWVGHPEHVRNLQEDFGLPEDRPWRDLLVTGQCSLDRETKTAVDSCNSYHPFAKFAVFSDGQINIRRTHGRSNGSLGEEGMQ